MLRQYVNKKPQIYLRIQSEHQRAWVGLQAVISLNQTTAKDVTQVHLNHYVGLGSTLN